MTRRFDHSRSYLMQKSLVDTDILSYYLRASPAVSARAAAYISEFGQLTFSVISVTEITYGWHRLGRSTRLTEFRQLCTHSEVLPLTQAVAERAGTVRASLESVGRTVPLADLFIAATALEAGLVLVTNNTRHFTHIPNLALDNWQSPTP